MTEQERHIKLRQIITSQGESILEQKKLVYILMDIGYFVGYRNIKKVFSTIVDEGYALKILLYLHGSINRDSAFNYIIDGLVSNFSYDIQSVSYALQCILYGLGIIDSVESFDDAKSLCWLNKLDSKHIDNLNDWNAEYVVFNVIPENSEIYVDYKLYKPQKGTAVIELGYGKHTYRVCADMYHTNFGDIIVKEGIQENIKISLNPNFGCLAVNCNAEDGLVYVDDKNVGKAPILIKCLISGKHKVEILSHLYKNYIDNVVIKDNEKYTLNAKLICNYGNVNIVCAKSESLIYIDNTYIGTGSWRGRLPVGLHKLECKLESYYTFSENLDVKISMNSEDWNFYKIPELKPFYGGIKVGVLPIGCIVNVDGNDVGTTPYRNKSLPIGQHVILVTNPESHKSCKYKINIELEKISEIVGVLPGSFKEDLENVKLGNYFYEDGTYSTNLKSGKICIGIVWSLHVSHDHYLQGWRHGRIILNPKFMEKNIQWQNAMSLEHVTLPNCQLISPWRLPTSNEWKEMFKLILGLNKPVFNTRSEHMINFVDLDFLRAIDDRPLWSASETCETRAQYVEYSSFDKMVRCSDKSKRRALNSIYIAAF